MASRIIQGSAIHFLDQGTGPVIVLLHGFPLDSRIWAGQVDALAAKYRLIVPDLPGFGRSTFDQPFTMESQADSIHELLAELGALPCVLAGLSMGGYIAQAFASKYVDDLTALILVDTKSEADTAEGKTGRDKMIAMARNGGTPAIVEAMLPKMLAADSARPAVKAELQAIMESQPAKTLEHALAAMRDRPDYTPMLELLNLPTLVIVGESDAIAPPSLAEGMKQKLKHGSLAVIPGAGHMSPIEQPTAVADAILRFLSP